MDKREWGGGSGTRHSKRKTTSTKSVHVERGGIVGDGTGPVSGRCNKRDGGGVG